MSNRSFEGLDATLGAMHLRPPTVVSADDTLAQVASAMVRDGVSCAILEEQPLRVVTEFDLARSLAEGLGPGGRGIGHRVRTPELGPALSERRRGGRT